MLMIPFAILLGLAGSVMVGYAARTLWISRPFTPGPCDMPSPDDDPCSGTLGHIGWHHRDGKQWFGDAWMLPTETVQAVRPPLLDDEFVRAAIPLLRQAGVTRNWVSERHPYRAAVCWIGGSLGVLMMIFPIAVFFEHHRIW